MGRVLLLGVLLSLISPLVIMGQTRAIDPFVMPSARFNALGGPHPAMADDFYSLFLNPAGFISVEESFSVAELSLSTFGPVLEIADLLGNADTLEGLDLSGVIGPSGFAAGFDMGGPLSLGYVGRGLGLGIFNRLRTSASLSGVSLRPLVQGEIFFTAGYAFRIIERDDHLFDAGFLGKGFYRGTSFLDAPIFDAATLLDDPRSQPFVSHLGVGLDLGIKYTLGRNFSAALVCYDFFSPVLISPYDSYDSYSQGELPSGEGSSYGAIKRRLDLGVAYKVHIAFLDPYITRLVLMASYGDILDLQSLIPRNPLLNLGLGAELTLLQVLSFRTGIRDALPAFGLGIDLSFMTVDLAIHGKELGLDPGVQSVYGLSLGLLFRY
ncbi:MAG: hypothetical protein FWH12_08100 [Treponema sp.]|nr:hypothetical protein [Treponema sp.]